ncbi:GntR family transcriptional regulator/GntR family frlABCD operon transcriptional regulator [Spirosoma lacussanchae]|uniref:GntR family transcriptional regulator n=1 Tax=Spirosoma lacussanchae TaxID=1884249 RepID=UPI00110904FD|nr:GntR family transcriptional regulator [Spirosoma lacussanchae]
MLTRPRQYQLIYESLKTQLTAGVYPKGSLLPSENELAVQFQTTRTTVRQALTELVRDGYIERQHGRGSIVRSERQTLGLLSFQGFSEVVAGGHAVRTTFLKPIMLQDWPSAFVFPLTDAERAVDCLALERIRYADEHPVMLEYTFVPNVGLDDMLTNDLLDGSLFRTLHQRYQLAIIDMQQRLYAVGATARQAAVFGCALHTPLLYMERRYLTSRPGLHVYSQLYCHTDKYAISNGL